MTNKQIFVALGGIALHYDPDHPEAHGDALEAAAIVVQECLKEGFAGCGPVVSDLPLPSVF